MGSTRGQIKGTSGEFQITYEFISNFLLRKSRFCSFWSKDGSKFANLIILSLYFESSFKTRASMDSNSQLADSEFANSQLAESGFAVLQLAEQQLGDSELSVSHLGPVKEFFINHASTRKIYYIGNYKE